MRRRSQIVAFALVVLAIVLAVSPVPVRAAAAFRRASSLLFPRAAIVDIATDGDTVFAIVVDTATRQFSLNKTDVHLTPLVSSAFGATDFPTALAVPSGPNRDWLHVCNERNPLAIVTLLKTTLVRTASNAFPVSRNGCTTLTFDATNSLLYVTTRSSPTQIAVALVLGSSTVDNGFVTLAASDVNCVSATLDAADAFLYLNCGAASAPFRVVKIATGTTPVRAGAFVGLATETGAGMAVVEAGAFLFAACGNCTPGVMVKVNVSAMTRVAALAVTSTGRVGGACRDNATSLLCVGITEGLTAGFATVNVPALTSAGTQLSAGADATYGKVVLADGFARRVIVAGNASTPNDSQLVEFAPTAAAPSLSLADSPLHAYTSASAPHFLVTDDAHVYVAPAPDAPAGGRVVKFDSAQLVRLASYQLTGTTARCLFVRGAFVFVCAQSAVELSGRLFKLLTLDMSLAASVAFAAGLADPTGFAATAAYAFAVFRLTPLRLVVVDDSAASMTQAREVFPVIGSNLENATSVAIAADETFALVAANTSPLRVGKVTLPGVTFGMTTFAAAAGVNGAGCLLLSGSAVAYVCCTRCSPARVLRIATASMTLSATVNVGAGAEEQNLAGFAALDTSLTVLFVASRGSGAGGALVRFSLSPSFARIDAASAPTPRDALRGVAWLERARSVVAAVNRDDGSLIVFAPFTGSTTSTTAPTTTTTSTATTTSTTSTATTTATSTSAATSTAMTTSATTASTTPTSSAPTNTTSSATTASATTAPSAATTGGPTPTSTATTGQHQATTAATTTTTGGGHATTLTTAPTDSETATATAPAATATPPTPSDSPNSTTGAIQSSATTVAPTSTAMIIVNSTTSSPAVQTPIVASAVAQSTAVGAASTVLASPGAFAVTFSALSVASIAACTPTQGDPSPVGWFEAPIPIVIGDDAVASRRGALVGNFLLIVAACVLLAGAAYAVAVVRLSSFALTTTQMRFPAIPLDVALGVFGPQTLASAATVLTLGSSSSASSSLVAGGIALAIFAVLAFFVAALALLLYVQWRCRVGEALVPNPDLPAVTSADGFMRLYRRVVDRARVWRESAFVARFGRFFMAYSVAWFLPVDYGATALLGMLRGAAAGCQSAGCCRVCATAALSVALTHAALFAWQRPRLALIDTILHGLSTLLNACSAAMAAAAVSSTSESGRAAALSGVAALSQASVALGAVILLKQGLAMAVGAWRARQKRDSQTTTASQVAAPAPRSSSVARVDETHETRGLP
jgi:hypothetical protein